MDVFMSFLIIWEIRRQWKAASLSPQYATILTEDLTLALTDFSAEFNDNSEVLTMVIIINDNMTMKNSWPIPITVILLFVAACAPVIREDLMKSGDRQVPLVKMRETPASFQGRLFILGGQIVKTEVTNTGSLLIEADYDSVDSNGYIVRKNDHSKGRYLALLTKDGRHLDPKSYSEKQYVTIAGVFTGVRTGKFHGTDYKYPVFEIKDIYLWPISRDLPLFYNFGGAEHSF